MTIYIQYPRTLVSLGLLPLALTARLQPTAATVRRNRPQSAPAEAS